MFHAVGVAPCPSSSQTNDHRRSFLPSGVIESSVTLHFSNIPRKPYLSLIHRPSAKLKRHSRPSRWLLSRSGLPYWRTDAANKSAPCAVQAVLSKLSMLGSEPNT